MFLSKVSLVLALSCIYCTTSFGEIKMFNASLLQICLSFTFECTGTNVSIEKRRLVQDLVLTYKIIFGLLDIDSRKFFYIRPTLWE